MQTTSVHDCEDTVSDILSTVYVYNMLIHVLNTLDVSNGILHDVLKENLSLSLFILKSSHSRARCGFNHHSPPRQLIKMKGEKRPIM